MNAQQNKSNNHPKNTNAQPKNTNAQPKNKNAQPNNMNAQPKNMNAQPNNMNAQLDNTELDLAIIFKSLSQVMQQYLTEKSLQKSESGQNQINNEPKKVFKSLKVDRIKLIMSLCKD